MLIERRRATAASGWLPPAIAARFTLAEQATLSAVVREIAVRGACELHVDALAALAGVSRRTVQNALRLAHDTGVLSVEERRRPGARSLPNRITILSRELIAWVTRRSRGGCKPLRPMSTEGQNPTVTMRLGTAGKRLGEGASRHRRGRSAGGG